MKSKIIMLMLIIVLSMVSTGVVMTEPASAATVISVPSGSTSEQIQAIIDSAAPGDTISFAPGSYNNVKVVINKTLNLVGNGAVIYGINESDTNIFKITANNASDASGSTVSGFEFYLLNSNVILSNKKLGSSGYAINLDKVSNVVVRNVTSHDGKAAVYNGASTNTLVENCTFTDKYGFCYSVHIMGGDNITVRKNTIIGAMDGVSMAQGAKNIYVDGNLFIKNLYCAFWGGGISNITYANNVFDSYLIEGLAIEKAANLTTVVNNTFKNGTGDAIYIMNSAAHGPMSVISSIEIINNLFKDISGAAIGIDKPGYFHGDGSGYSIVGVNNSVQNVSKGYVVLYSNSNAVSVTNNLNFTLDSSYPIEPVNPVISITSAIASTVIKTGDKTIYTVTVKNTGKSKATNVNVSDILKTAYFSSSTTYSSLGNYSNGIWNIGTLTAGDTASLVITATAKKAGTTSSQAKVTADNNIKASSNTITKTINKYVKLSYANSVSSTNIKQGNLVYLTTKVLNSGKDVSDPVKIKITLPSGMKLVSVTSSGYFDKKTNTWTYKCSPGKTYTFTAKAQVTSKGTKKVTFSNNGKTVTKTISGY